MTHKCDHLNFHTKKGATKAPSTSNIPLIAHELRYLAFQSASDHMFFHIPALEQSYHHRKLRLLLP